VDLETPKCFAAARMVARFSMMYTASLHALCSRLSFTATLLAHTWFYDILCWMNGRYVSQLWDKQCEIMKLQKKSVVSSKAVQRLLPLVIRNMKHFLLLKMLAKLEIVWQMHLFAKFTCYQNRDCQQILLISL